MSKPSLRLLTGREPGIGDSAGGDQTPVRRIPGRHNKAVLVVCYPSENYHQVKRLNKADEQGFEARNSSTSAFKSEDFIFAYT